MLVKDANLVRWKRMDNPNHKKRLETINNRLLGNGGIPGGLDTALVTGSHPLAQWMAENFNHNFDDYDRAIDAVYNSTHIGGSSTHHLLDGQHTILGAFGAVKDVSVDDSFAKEFLEAGEHLLRDTASVSGINPLISFDSKHWEKLVDFASTQGISRTYLADALTVNGPELIGGVLAVLSGAVMVKKKDPGSISKLSGTYLVSSLASANPLLVPIAAGGLVYSLSNTGDKMGTLKQAGKGAITSGGSIMVGSLVGGPIWIGCVASVCAAMAINYSLDNPEKAYTRMVDISKNMDSVFRKVSLSTLKVGI